MKAEKLLINGVIYTVDENNTKAEALGINDNKIVFIGSKDESKEWIDESTEMIDLKGGIAFPGFIDAHNHVPMGSITETCEIALTGIYGKENTLDVIKKFVDSNSDLNYYSGLGYNRADYDEDGPRKEWLDEICEDKPIVLLSSDGHSCWLNSKAFELAGITNDTISPPGGHYKKDAITGELLGLCQGEPTIQLAKSIIPKHTKEDYKKAFIWAQEFLHENGFTGMYDAQLELKYPTIYEAYNELAKEGKLNLRVRAGWFIAEPMNEDQIDEFLETTEELSKEFNTPYFQANSIKILADGVVEESTAYFIDPYCDRDDGYRGEPIVDKESLKVMADKIDKKGLQIHMHQIGDATAKEALDVFEYIENKNGKRDSRNTFAHVQHIQHNDIDRMAKLGMVAVIAPHWVCYSAETHGDVYIPRLGIDRASSSYLFKTIADKNIPYAYHSDYYVSEPIATDAIICGTTRQWSKRYFDYYYEGSDLVISNEHNFPSKRREIIPPLPPYDEVLTKEQVIKCLTYNGAYAHFLEKEVGSLEVGKLADITIFDENIMKLGNEKIDGKKPSMTIFDGKIVYKSEK